MANIILVAGGCRSGKSAYAQQLALLHVGRRFYVATGAVFDEEMAQRIRQHQAERRSGWTGTIEEQTDLCRALATAADDEIYLIDSVGMWVNNLLFHQPTLDEAQITTIAEQLFVTLGDKSCTVIFVADEVGMGIIAADALSRRFCDLNGRMNQLIAAIANQATLMSCGMAIRLK